MPRKTSHHEAVILALPAALLALGWLKSKLKVRR